MMSRLPVLYSDVTCLCVLYNDATCLGVLQADDLQIIMRYLEHWAHRLFPKMPFDEVLERIEKLGTKNEVKVRTIISFQTSWNIE
jgi:uncharacterized protein YozE (UPF0346 family)